jgi:hypothetical protein
MATSTSLILWFHWLNVNPRIESFFQLYKFNFIWTVDFITSNWTEILQSTFFCVCLWQKLKKTQSLSDFWHPCVASTLWLYPPEAFHFFYAVLKEGFKVEKKRVVTSEENNETSRSKFVVNVIEERVGKKG